MVLFLDFQFNVTLFVQLLLQLRLPPPPFNAKSGPLG